MASVTITVQPAQIDAVRAAILTLYQVAAEALDHACEAHLRERAASAGVCTKRTALLEVDALIAQAGVELGRAERSPLSLSGSESLVVDALHAALLEAVERLDAGARALSRGRSAPGEVHALAGHVVAVVDLLIAAEVARG